MTLVCEALSPFSRSVSISLSVSFASAAPHHHRSARMCVYLCLFVSTCAHTAFRWVYVNLMKLKNQEDREDSHGAQGRAELCQKKRGEKGGKIREGTTYTLYHCQTQRGWMRGVGEVWVRCRRRVGEVWVKCGCGVM